MEFENAFREEAKIPWLVIFWASTRVPLTHLELVELTGALVASGRPGEVLIRVPDGRLVRVLAANDPSAPRPPEPKRRTGYEGVIVPGTERR